MPEIIIKDPNSLEVEIEGKVYDLSKIPEYEDKLVQKEVANVLNQLSLKDITENLYLTVELFYVAYNGVAGARGGTIQAEIASIQSDLALLCNECVETMTSFKSETQNILKLLVDMYRWLTNGKENLAIKKLTHCSESSATMSEAANHLAEKFKELQIRSTKARSNTIEEEASEQDKKLAAEKAERELRAKQEAEKKNNEELVAQIGEMQEKYDEAKSREEKEATKSLILGVTSAIASSIGAGLGAFAAAKNPVSTAISSTVSNAQVAKAQQDMNEKKAQSDKAQQELLTAKDDQTKKKNRVDGLTSEIDTLNKQIAQNEKNQEVLTKLKQQLDAKKGELSTAKSELTTADAKIVQLQKTSNDSTAAYSAAASSLQELAKSTGQMTQAAASAEESIHAEKMSFLNQKLSLEKQKRESLVALTQYAETVKNLKTEEGMATVSVNSLHAAVEALGKIIATLTNASLFWDQMSSYCKKMTNQDFQQTIKDLTEPDSGLSEAERIKEYKSLQFMRQFLSYMCQWVAINGLSGEYLITAGEAQKKAVEYLKQSPTIEEALKKAPELAKNMEVMLNKNLLESGKVIAELEQQKSLIDDKKS
jgi:predicted  nucleic acid-binding Zn-ribbon protein